MRISSKCHWTVGPVNLNFFKKIHQTVGGQLPYSYLVRQKNKTVVVGYSAGPSSVLPDMTGRSDVIGKDCDRPSKHAYRWTITWSQRCFNAGTPSTTLAQHLVSVTVLSYY